MVDGDTWASTISTNFSYVNIKFLMGKKHYETEVDSSFGSYTTHYPLWGQIEMIATRPAYCELSTLNSLINELKGVTKVSEFDELGMLKKVEIHECGKSILSNTHDYKKRSSNTKYISKQVSQETIKFGSSSYIRKYETDALGNITKITDNLFGNHTYKYDYRGFLIEADNETYEYDNNGNITKKGNLTANYDTTIKDRIVSFNGKDIEYDSINPLNPKSYGSNSYKFEGRRLVRWTYGGGYYDYVYNDQGLRIQKKDYRGVTWNYTYDGDRLIRETSNNATLDFLYDENGNLYGFIKDNTDKYFYIRDAFQNILGIVDALGNIVVKYFYNAWGTTINTQDTSSSNIGSINPFRYKGYYYDGESGMYYCKTRYYVPLWGRWLNADSSSQIKPENIVELNLFNYCNNNPILGYDPVGLLNWWKLGTIVLSVFAIIAATAAAIVSCGVASVAATIAITSMISIGSRIFEVGALQYKKSKEDGDSGTEIFSDIIDAIFANGLKIIGLTPFTKLGGFTSGFYSQSSIFANVYQLIKADGFHLNTLLGVTIYSIGDRFKHFGDYMSLTTTKFGYIFGYIGAFISNDYEWIADKRNYILF